MNIEVLKASLCYHGNTGSKHMMRTIVQRVFMLRLIQYDGQQESIKFPLEATNGSILRAGGGPSASRVWTWLRWKPDSTEPVIVRGKL